MTVRYPIVAAAVALLLAACSREEPASRQAFVPRPPLSRADHLAGIDRHFDSADRDHDGVLDTGDFSHFPDRLKIWDTDGDGRVTRAQFRAEEIRRFAAADTDHDGEMTGAERVRAGWSGPPRKN